MDGESLTKNEKHIEFRQQYIMRSYSGVEGDKKSTTLPPAEKACVIYRNLVLLWASLVAQMVKNLPAVQETLVQSLGWEDPGEGNGYPLQYSGLENSMDREAWWATVHQLARVGRDWCLFAAYHAVSESQWVPGFPASDLSGWERKFTSLQGTPEPWGLTRMC